MLGSLVLWDDDLKSSLWAKNFDLQYMEGVILNLHLWYSVAIYSSLVSMYFLWKKIHVTCACLENVSWVVQVKQYMVKIRNMHMEQWCLFENEEYAHGTMVSIV